MHVDFSIIHCGGQNIEFLHEAIRVEYININACRFFDVFRN